MIGDTEVRPGVRGHAPWRVLLIAMAAALAAATGVSLGRLASAATPGSGSIDGSAPLSWSFAPVGGLQGGTDSYKLTVHLPTSDAAFYAPDVRQGTRHAAVLTVTDTWRSTTPDQTVSLSGTDAHGNTVGDGTGGYVDDGSGTAVFEIEDPLNATYTITAGGQLGASSAAVASHAVATLEVVDLAAQTQPAAPAAAPRFEHYHIPLSLMPPREEETVVLGGRAFGEPSIGVDPRTDAVMYQAGLYTIRATFDAAKPRARVTWADVSDVPLETTASEDALLYVDRGTGRTEVSQLTAVCSLGAVTDDDGATWTTAPKPCQTPAGADHQTIGAGPFAAPLPHPGVAYPDAMYYCSQNVVEAECALSVDGGLTYGLASPMWTSLQCFGLHGHVKVAPNDGTVYVPDKGCGAPECLIVTSTAGPNCHPGFAVSTDNGATWTAHTIADMHTRQFNGGDPSIGVGALGTMYFGYNDRDGRPKVAVCTSQGTACGPSVDVSGSYHIANSEMPTLVAGDDQRAAFAFLGSATPGDDQQPTFVGTWHLYVAFTYDGGQHWTTVDTTPDHPVQRGCIEFNANVCPSTRGSDDQRNLLDFNDITLDREGRVLAAYTDGCQPEVTPAAHHGTCLTDATRLSGLNPEIEGPAFARQVCGLGLYAKYDAQAVPCAAGARIAPPNAGTQPVLSTLVSTPDTVSGGVAALVTPIAIASTAFISSVSRGRRRKARRRVSARIA